jgi:radical SAM protein (TIGR01212 family)
LRERYNAALIDSRIKVLAIGTRPDCITEEIAELIASFKDRVDVWTELGLQTASDKTAKTINRGYPTEIYMKAARILNEREIPFVTHIMIGLPGEGDVELEQTVAALNLSGSWGIKIHSVYVARDTELAGMYERGEYEPIDLETYAERAAYVLTHISPLTVVHRLTGDCPRNMLVAPEWNKDKNAILALIRKKLEERGLRQGSFNMR